MITVSLTKRLTKMVIIPLAFSSHAICKNIDIDNPHISVNVCKDSAADFDWSAPVTQIVEEKLELNWDDLDGNDEKEEDVVDEAKTKCTDIAVKTEKGKSVGIIRRILENIRVILSSDLVHR